MTIIPLIDGTKLQYGNDGWATYDASGAKARNLTARENMLVQAAYKPQFVAELAQQRLDQNRERLRYLESQVQRDGLAMTALHGTLEAKNAQIEILMLEVHRLRLKAEQRMGATLLKVAGGAVLVALGFAWQHGAA